MKKLIGLVFVLLFPLCVSALQFSPTTLEFGMKENEVLCKKINFEIENFATVRDAWAENSDDGWSVSNFKTSAEGLGLVVNYPMELNSEEKEIQVCLSGSKPGNYKGALVFREQKVGNSIIQFAVWLKVSVAGTVEEPEENAHEDEDETHSSKSSGKSTTSHFYDDSVSAQNFQELGFELPNEKIKLGSGRAKEDNVQSVLMPFLISALILFVVFLFVLAVGRK
jgi:hypothetical protein